tara:strand:+ start:1462 stop:1758 length:297 start_codon:yes stop_codon:yes gene_type:complete
MSVKSKAELSSQIANTQFENIGNLIDSAHNADNVLASGSVSGSSISTGSFGSAILANLPTVEPLTTGSLFLTGSGAMQGGSSTTGSAFVMVSGVSLEL